MHRDFICCGICCVIPISTWSHNLSRYISSRKNICLAATRVKQLRDILCLIELALFTNVHIWPLLGYDHTDPITSLALELRDIYESTSSWESLSTAIFIVTGFLKLYYDK